MLKTDIEEYYPKTKNDWRKWLNKNHKTKQAVWLIMYKKQTGIPSLNWSDAVDEALCFGWIDSTARPIDGEKYKQYFTKRKPQSTWSKVNKVKIEKLIADGLMSEAGLASIEIAKQNGSWTILDEVEEMIIPKDLEKAFKAKRGSKDFFMSLSKSVRKGMLQWITLAKLEETKLKRINEIAELACEGKKPKQF